MSKKKKVRLSKAPKAVLIRKLEAQKRSAVRQSRVLFENYSEANGKLRVKIRGLSIQLRALKS